MKKFLMILPLLTFGLAACETQDQNGQSIRPALGLSTRGFAAT